MNASDSQLEALAFNYLSFGFSRIVSNIWAWVIVVSGAVNFWLLSAVRIVSGATGSADQPTAGPSTAPKAVLAAVVETATEGMTRGGKFTKALSDQPTIVSTTVTRTVVAVVETIEGTTRGGKFRVFYEGDEVEGEAVTTLGVLGRWWVVEKRIVIRVRIGIEC